MNKEDVILIFFGFRHFWAIQSPLVAKRENRNG